MREETNGGRAIFGLSAILLMGAILVGWQLARDSGEVSPETVDPQLSGFSPAQRDALAPRVEERERLQGILRWNIASIAWLKRNQRVPDVLSCDWDGLHAQLARVASKDLPHIGGDDCAPVCAAPDPRLLKPRACPPARSSHWAELETTFQVPPGYSPPPMSSPLFVKRASIVGREITTLRAQISELRTILPVAHHVFVESIFACTADAAGIQVEFLHVGALRPLPELSPTHALHEFPVLVRVAGPRDAVARWAERLARRPEIISTEWATLAPHPEDPGLVLLETEVRLFVLNRR